MIEVIGSLYCDKKDNLKDKLKKCWLISLFTIPYVVLLIIAHWLILAIIGVRIYVDNFSRETGQGNISETGSYKVAPYTGYMIFCGAYLPVASVIVYIILNRVWLSDVEMSKLKKTFYFLIDPVAYIAVPFLIAPLLITPFIVFCAAIYLPDYDSSGFEVDSNARNSAEVLGTAFIIIFILCNIKATVILIVAVIIIPFIIVCKVLYHLAKCLCSEDIHE